ncbi:MAG: PIN domain-containing protein [Thermoanaerobaculia bacterium]
MTALLDTGIVYAYYDRRDDWHSASYKFISSEVNLIIPSPVIPEVDYLLGKRLGFDAQAVFYRSLVEGVFNVVDLTPGRYARIAEINLKYNDLRLGFVDLAILALAEHLNIGRIATTDRRHFGAVQLTISLKLVPDAPRTR